MYETGTATSVRAFHVMPGMPPPEGQRHAHDYQLEVLVSRDELDDRGMVIDLDVLDGALRDIAARLDGADLDDLVPSDLVPSDLVPSDEGAGVTVEVFARWVHARLAAALGSIPGTTLGVRVWESDVAFGGYRAPLAPA